MPNLNYNFLNAYDSLSLVNVPLCVIDFTGKNVLSCFCGGISELNVYPDFSNLVSLNFIENWGYYIDFGDGTIVKELTGSHIYNIPGTYTITLVVPDSGGNMFKSVTQPKIEVYNLIPDTLSITYLSGNTVVSSTINTPLLVTRFNSYQTYPALSSIGYSINLSVSGNKSNFVTTSSYESDQYSHLKLFSAFLSGSSFTPIQTIQTTSDPVYAQINPISNDILLYSSPALSLAGVPTYFVGTSGIATIYYYEDYNPTIV